MAEKLYAPGELRLVHFVGNDEGWITVTEVLNRAESIGAVKGKEQADFLWDRCKQFPMEWRKPYVVVPDVDGCCLQIFAFVGVYYEWYRFIMEADDECNYFYCLLSPL